MEKKERKACVRDLFSLILRPKRSGKTTRIISAFEQNASRLKRLRKPERIDVDEYVHKWFKQQRSENAPVSGSLFRDKSRGICEEVALNFLREGEDNRMACCRVAQCVRRVSTHRYF
jgi:hypothetical protein